jgi:hypothetical protein
MCASPVQRGGANRRTPRCMCGYSLPCRPYWLERLTLLSPLISERTEALFDRRDHLAVRLVLVLQPAPHLGPECALVHLISSLPSAA